ncbi:NUDIX domain-containing protein [Rhodococcoides yunnanense]|jgi:predicted NUDIX family NTP pyrophosphohydrolase|uniref:NUDIX domain-containing protein n=1 Tax=Rhodococcoides yunnanense TaxID=278209 RepID=UPI0022B19762|nr:NUDIX domain-containing protein [Rhodococcus yunnanensis]MCZ4277971.1 NUDIX domain-containing protein [Rhodococcus yunnanensis]
MPKHSAGLLPYRFRDGVVEVLIGHPGGPFWARKDDGVWSVIKGEYTDEDPLVAARREFREETGLELPDGEAVALPVIRQRGGKVVTVFAVEADIEVDGAVSNTFEMEWPPRSGKTQSFPELDRFEWCSVERARIKLLAAQAALLDGLPPSS